MQPPHPPNCAAQWTISFWVGAVPLPPPPSPLPSPFLYKGAFHHVNGVYIQDVVVGFSGKRFSYGQKKCLSQHKKGNEQISDILMRTSTSF